MAIFVHTTATASKAPHELRVPSEVDLGSRSVPGSPPRTAFPARYRRHRLAAYRRSPPRRSHPARRRRPPAHSPPGYKWKRQSRPASPVQWTAYRYDRGAASRNPHQIRRRGVAADGIHLVAKAGTMGDKNAHTSSISSPMALRRPPPGMVHASPDRVSYTGWLIGIDYL